MLLGPPDVELISVQFCALIRDVYYQGSVSGSYISGIVN